jgi:hypothetical protein
MEGNNNNNNNETSNGCAPRNLVAEAIDGIVFPKLDASAHCWKVNCKYTVNNKNKKQQEGSLPSSAGPKSGHLPFILK